MYSFPRSGRNSITTGDGNVGTAGAVGASTEFRDATRFTGV